MLCMEKGLRPKISKKCLLIKFKIKILNYFQKQVGDEKIQWGKNLVERKIGGNIFLRKKLVGLSWHGKNLKRKKLMGKSLGIKSRRLKLTKKENPNIFTDLLKNFYWMIHLIHFIHLIHLFILFILLDDSPAHM